MSVVGLIFSCFEAGISRLWPIHTQKVKVKGHSVQKLKWKKTSDGRTEANALPLVLALTITVTTLWQNDHNYTFKWVKHSTFKTFYFVPESGAKYCYEYVCLYPPSHISETSWPNFTKLLRMLPAAEARSSSDIVAMRYLLPVLLMSSFTQCTLQCIACTRNRLECSSQFQPDFAQR